MIIQSKFQTEDKALRIHFLRAFLLDLCYDKENAREVLLCFTKKDQIITVTNMVLYA
ncbi:hypothetical protein HMPREF0813_01028 [Streptococcus anginosus F0211]|uniref:Uncharacterized protein n=1 Tax=Streptococcus anginosus F0211 TaxID=706437 RepID=E6J1A3_STRAP|nr:hypothetical protein HMPREF0813_01028 [Streptococcus anginosus F0211]